MNDQSVTAACGFTNVVEDPEYQVNLQQVCVLWNRVPEQLTLKKGMQVMSFKFVMTVDGFLSVAKQEMYSGECSLPVEKCIMYSTQLNSTYNNKANLI